jgi:hypothetical protein
MTPDKLAALAADLIKAEQAVADGLGSITMSEYHIGLSLKNIRDNALYLAATPHPFDDFRSYLASKELIWRKSTMTLYNYINMTEVPEDKVQIIGMTNGAKLGALKNIDPRAADSALNKVVKAIESGKKQSEVTSLIEVATSKAREKKGLGRIPGRKGKDADAQNSDATPAPDTTGDQAMKEVITATGRVGQVPIRMPEQTLDLAKMPEGDHWAYKATGKINGTDFEVLISINHMIVRLRPC